MPTTDELHAADQRLEAAIEEMRRQRAHDAERLDKAETNIERLNEFMSELRETLATKEDIAGLRADLRERETLHERIDHYRERLTDMEDADKHAEGMRVNWMMLALFVGELAIGASQLWIMLRHG